ncbi:MAG TPA: hypothetical protein VFX64_02185 [Candidatus Nitrosotalea sp.]|nr:hypothetical protein [Candidatus Nitrosotalea sp.]
MQDSIQDSVGRDDFLSMNTDIRIRNAIQIARKFLEQYNSPVVFKSASLNDTICDIVMDIGLTHERIVQVKVDTVTGIILEYTQ